MEDDKILDQLIGFDLNNYCVCGVRYYMVDKFYCYCKRHLKNDMIKIRPMVEWNLEQVDLILPKESKSFFNKLRQVSQIKSIDDLSLGNFRFHATYFCCDSNYTINQNETFLGYHIKSKNVGMVTIKELYGKIYQHNKIATEFNDKLDQEIKQINTELINQLDQYIIKDLSTIVINYISS